MAENSGIIQKVIEGLKHAVLEKGTFIYRIHIPAIRRNRRKIEARPAKSRIRVGFLVQCPENWATLQSVWDGAVEDDRIEPVALLVPEIELAYYLILKKVVWEKTYAFGEKVFGDRAIRAYNPDTGAWQDPKAFDLDYIIIQRPFETYLPKGYRAGDFSRFAKVCYIPYSFLVTTSPRIKEIEYNSHFIRNVSMIFCEKQASLDYVNRKFAQTIRKGDQKAFSHGYPKFDLIKGKPGVDSALWPRKRDSGIYRMIWTPRWTTDPALGGSHFFDYKDQMIAMAEKDPTIDLVFRPHPLALDHYVSAGLMTAEDRQDYLDRYAQCMNANIDRTTEYDDTFFSSDCLVTDITSVLIDYLFTGKPIVYCTSPIDQYLFAPELHECLYKVESFDEITRTVEQLRKGIDPKKELREKVVRMLRPDGSAAAAILEEIRKDYPGYASGKRAE